MAQFKKQFRGYNKKQVNTHIEGLQAQIEALNKQKSASLVGSRFTIDKFLNFYIANESVTPKRAGLP